MLKNVLQIAVKAILVNKTRSFLTTLGVIIGVGSVVMLTSIGTGLTIYVTEQFDELGANTVLVYPGDIFGENGGFSRENQISAFSNSQFTLRDIARIRQLREFVDLVVPFNTQNDTISFRNTEKSVTVIGTSHEYNEAQGNANVEIGEFFSESDDNTAERVVAIGHAVAEEIFGEVDPIGKRVKIGSQTFTVVGVMEEIGGSFGGPSFDTYIFIPLQTAFKLYDNESILEIIVKTQSKETVPETIEAIEKEMLKYYEEDEFTVFDQSEILDTINQILGVLTVGLGGISSISLVVGGIGIMNIMLVSVTERTREIGLRKALGATPKLILLQFLIEAALLSVLGGMIGVGLAYLGTVAAQAYFPARITPQAVLLAFGVSVLVGLVFGVAPARKAAKLSPIEALRYE